MCLCSVALLRLFIGGEKVSALWLGGNVAQGSKWVTVDPAVNAQNTMQLNLVNGQTLPCCQNGRMKVKLCTEQTS